MSSEISVGRYCPLYGKYASPNYDGIISQNGNQCPLFINSYTPCKREINGEVPDLEKCSLNNPKNRKNIEKMLSLL